MLEYSEINALSKATACVIWMHGLGADGHDFEPVVRALNMPHIYFMLPHAHVQKVTLNHGYEMRAWYDITGLNASSQQDEIGIRKSQAEIELLILKAVNSGIAPERIVLAGFSQGGAMALHTALRHPQSLAGVLALSTYLPLSATLHQEKHAANLKTPIFMAHGRFDEVITLSTCERSKAILLQEGYTLEWHEYAMAHSLTQQEIDDIHDFLQRKLPKTSPK